MIQYRLAEQQWFTDEFWKQIGNIVEFAKTQTSGVDEERLTMAVLQDWLALAVPLGRA